jgi:MoxR-like ATPase
MKFQGSDKYVATQDLMLAVNAAATLQRPCSSRASPAPARPCWPRKWPQALDMPLLQWHIKSTTKAQQGLYEYDAEPPARFAAGRRARQGHSQLHRQGRAVAGLHGGAPVALLIDEIDKADIEFPNDLLRELDRMEFYCYETHEMIRAKHRPLVFITSNNEKELPDAFLRRCFFHYIKFPDADTMRQIVDVHFPKLQGELLNAAMKVFYDVRNLPGLKKKPSTSELIDWLKLLVAEEIPASALQSEEGKVSVPPWLAPAQERTGYEPV